MSSYLPDLEAIAREAGTLLMGYLARHVKIEYKGEVDLVTPGHHGKERWSRPRAGKTWRRTCRSDRTNGRIGSARCKTELKKCWNASRNCATSYLESGLPSEFGKAASLVT